MTEYVALLRGISPLNPNMRNEKLRGVFTRLGFKNVRTVITSGNVLFETEARNMRQLEASIEKALPQQLGFTSTVIIRSRNGSRGLPIETRSRELKTPQAPA